MFYYKLSPNPADKKWRGYENAGIDLFFNGETLSPRKLSKCNYKLDYNFLEFKRLKNGKIPPINSIGASFIIFDRGIKEIETINDTGIQLIPLVNSETKREYSLMHLYIELDCVNWEKSDLYKWGENDIIKEWQNKRARWFFRPALFLEKIPEDIQAFKLKEWGDAFNIVISEKLKEKILKLDFDHSFLVFEKIGAEISQENKWYDVQKGGTSHNKR